MDKEISEVPKRHCSWCVDWRWEAKAVPLSELTEYGSEVDPVFLCDSCVKLVVAQCSECGHPVREKSNLMPYKSPSGNEEFRHGSCVPRYWWVNVHLVTRQYGGPAEGGDWYNVGEARAGVPIKVGEDPKPHIDRLTELYAAENEGNIYSVNGGAEIHVTVSENPARDWPEEPYRYE